jgi:uncharacterized protein YbjT (DUF2867 family)
MILVVGATGHLGGLIAHSLLARGILVRALVRHGSPLDPQVAAGAEVIHADLKDPASLRRACAGVNAVVTTATATDRQGDDTIASVDHRGALNLIAAAEMEGVRRFVFISALGADPHHPMPLLRAKGAVERRLRESELAWTIVQPNLFLDKLPVGVVGGPALGDQPVTLVGEGTRRHSMVATRDVAAYAVAALDRDQAAGQTLVVGGPQALSMRDIVKAFEHELGRSIPVQTVPPGQQVPGMPPVVTELLAALETYQQHRPGSHLLCQSDIGEGSCPSLPQRFQPTLKPSPPLPSGRSAIRTETAATTSSDAERCARQRTKTCLARCTFERSMRPPATGTRARVSSTSRQIVRCTCRPRSWQAR